MEPILTLINDGASVWGRYFLAAIAQNSVFLLLVFAALWTARRAPARVRSWIATIGVVKLALPPFVPLAWLRPDVAGTVADPVGGLLFPFEALESGDVTTGLTGFTPVALLMLVWLSVVLIRFGASTLQTLQLALDVREAQRIPDEELPVPIRDESARGMSVWKSRRVPLPLTLGIRPRRIFVPADWDRWSEADRRSVLLHEMAHVHRRDGVVQFLEIVVRALYFFLPPVHWLAHRLHTYREMACDDRSVPADPHARLHYSRFLCSLAESMMDRPPTTASASTLARRKGELLDRVAYQVKEGSTMRFSKKQFAAVLTVLLLAAPALSLVYGDAPAPPAPPKAPEPVETPAPPAPEAAVQPEAEAPKAPEKVKEPKPAKIIKKGEKSKDAPPPPKKPVHVSLVDGKKKLKVDGSVVGYDEFKLAMKKAVAKRGEKCLVAIDGTSKVTMKQLHAVQSDLKDLGLLKVVYTGEIGKLPMVLPPAEAKKKLAQLPDDQVVHVKVDGSGLIHCRGKTMKCAKLPQLVAHLIQEDPNRVIVLHTKKDTQYGDFVMALDSLKKGGAEKIAIADPS